MAQKWNLGDIVPPERERRVTRRAREVEVSQTEREEVTERSSPRRQARSSGGGRSGMRRIIYIVLFLILGVGGIALSTFIFGGAQVTVYPKYKDIDVNAALTGKLQPATGELGYELLSIEDTAERKVSAGGQERVTERAEGKVTIYNNYSTGSQRLIKNTRFEAPGGLIFRVSESVEVPGMKKNADGTTVPGSIEATVFADGTGERYNIGPSKFTVPGLKGSDQYDKITAESKAPFTGGFEGLKYIVSDADLNEARNALQQELRTKLTERLKTERPTGFVFYDSSIVFSFESLPATDAGNQMVTIKEKGYLKAPLFKADAFAKEVARKGGVVGYSGEPVRLEDPASLTFAYATSTDITTAENMPFTVKGQTRVIWTYDAEKLRIDLKGLSSSALPVVLSGYPAIERAEAVVKPFWKNSFPNNVEEITIKESVGATP